MERKARKARDGRAAGIAALYRFVPNATTLPPFPLGPAIGMRDVASVECFVHSRRSSMERIRATDSVRECLRWLGYVRATLPDVSVSVPCPGIYGCPKAPTLPPSVALKVRRMTRGMHGATGNPAEPFDPAAPFARRDVPVNP